MENSLPKHVNDRRRRSLFIYTILAMIAYQLSFAVVFLANYATNIEYNYHPLKYCYFAFLACSTAALIMTRLKKQITKPFIFFILHFQSAICIFVAIYLFYLLGNQRYLVLIATQVILMFVFIQSSLKVSILTILFVVAGYLTSSYIGIFNSGQPGSYSAEILCVSIFVPVCIFIAYMSNRMQDQQKEIKSTNSILKATYVELEEQNGKIIDSLHYAEMIQRSLLPGIERVKAVSSENMFIWMPKDIVGGDIFYTYTHPEGSIIALIDCTGHGVPGAFLTMIVYSEIRKIIMDEACREPSKILNRLGRAVKNVLHKNDNDTKADDGLDAAVCFIDHSGQKVIYAGARVPLFYIKNGTLLRENGDKQSIGYKDSIDDYDFTNHTINVEQQCSFYMKTDGYTDQLGGEKGLRLGTNKFKQLIQENHNKPYSEQRQIFLQTLINHKGEYEQMDDITLIGFQV